MTFPSRSLALALLLAPFAVGCGEKTTETDTDIDTEAGTDAPEYFEPDFAIIEGRFGYDAENNQARPYLFPVLDGEGNNVEQPIFFEVRLLNSDDYDPDDDFTYCVVQYGTDTLTPQASWFDTANGQDGRTLSFGFTLPDSAQSGSTCGDFDFDPAVWGEGDDPAGDAIMQWAWGMSMGEELTAGNNDILDSFEEFIVEQLSQEDWDTDYAPYVFNSPLYWSAIDAAPAPNLGGLIDINYGLGYAVDENFVLQYVDNNENGVYDAPTAAGNGDDLVPIDAADVLAGNAPSGAYISSAWFALSAECLLGLEFCP